MTSPPLSGAPDPLRHRSLLFGFAPAAGRWRAALVATLALVVPAAGLTAAGFQGRATLVALGAFTAMYATAKPYRARIGFLAAIAFIMTLSVFVGALAGLAHRPLGTGVRFEALVVVVMTIASAVAVFAANALRLGPPGGFFAAMVTGLAAHVVALTSFGDVMVATALGAAAAWLISCAPLAWRSRGPERRVVERAEGAVAAHDAMAGPRTRTSAAQALLDAWVTIDDAGLDSGPLVRRLWAAHLRFASTNSGRPAQDPLPQVPLGRSRAAVLLRDSVRPVSSDVLVGMRVVLAVAASGALAIAAGTGRPDWAMVAALLVLHNGVDRVRNSYRALHRVLGTAVGIALFVACAAADLRGLALVALLGVLQFVIEMLVVRQYAVAVTFITALVLLISEPSGHIDLHLALDRLVDTMIGAAVATLVLWTTGRRFDAAVLPAEVERTEQAISELRTVLTRVTPTDDAALEARRTLQLRLLDAAAGADVAHLHRPHAARSAWPRYLRSQDAGYALLAHCWLHPDQRSWPDDAADSADVE